MSVSNANFKIRFLLVEFLRLKRAGVLNSYIKLIEK